MIICIYVGTRFPIMAKELTSLRLNDQLVKKAQKALGTKTRTQTIELSLEAVVEAEKHRKLIKRYSGKARPGDFERS
jgi:Arc/MetJ family transcription regulator